MGFSDVFGKSGFLGQLGETLQDTGWFIGAPVATAVDLAKAGFDDNISFGGALTKGINRGTQLFLGDNQGTEDKSDDQDNLISPSIKTAMDGLEWVYDNAIAQPINTLNIELQRGLADVTGTEDNASVLDIGSAWDRADESKGGYGGKGTSIGREYANTIQGAQGIVPALAGKLGVPQNIFGWRDGPQPQSYFASLTDEGQKQLNEQSKMYDVQSGAIDATARWFLDPTIVLGKASKALKFTAFIRDVKDTAKLEKMLNENQAWGGIFSSFSDRLEKANDFNMGLDIKGPRSAAEIHAANPGLQAAGGDGWNIAQAMESASKTLWKQGAEPDEIRAQGKLIALAGLGDPNALKAIDSRVADARDSMAALRSQRDDLAMARDWALHQNGQAALDSAQTVANRFVDDVISRGEDYLSSDEFLAMTNERLKAITPQFRAAQSEAARLQKLQTSLLESEASLRSYPLLSGVRGGTAAMAKRAGKELGTYQSPFAARTDFIFQSSAWNKAVKLKVPTIAKVLTPHIALGAKAVRKFNTPQAPRVIEFHDDNAPLALNNFLKHSAVAPEKREELVSALAAARTEGSKRSIVENAVMHAQGSMIDKYLKENPRFTEATAKIVIAEQAKQIQRESQRVGLQTKKFTAHKKQDGSPGDAIVDDDGIVQYAPLLETQLENQMVLPDLKMFTKILDHHSGWLTDMSEWAQGNRLPNPSRISELAAKFFDSKVEKHPYLDVKVSNSAERMKLRKWRVDQFIDSGLSALTKAWKYGMLLRPAYPMRVLIDSDMRALAVLGPVAFGQHFAPRAFGFATMGSASRIKTHFAAQADEQKLLEYRTDIQKFEDKWRGQTDEPIVDEVYDDLKAKAAEIEARLERYRTGGRRGRNEAYGRFGEVGQKDIETVMGKIPGAFADDYGRTQRYIASSKTFAGLIGDSQKLHASNLMSENWVSLTPSDAGHTEAWLHAINAQLKQSVLGKKAIEFQARNADDPERAVKALQSWMRTTSEGRAIKGRMAWDTANSEMFAREIVGYVNHYLPTQELREKALTDRIGRIDLESAYPDPLSRPPVHGPALARAMGRGSMAGTMINDWFSRTMKWLSDAPEDQLARHPMYSAVYEQAAKRHAEYLHADPTRKDIGLDEIHELIQKRAHKEAQKSIKTYMFDVAAQSDLSHALRFYSPFIAAWEDTVRKWGKIASDKPDLLGKAYLGWNAPNAMGLVVDKDGHPVARDDFNSETYMLVRAPSWVPAIGGKDLSLAGSHFRIPKQAVNIILQGGLQPGFGPLVAIPTSKLQVANPELDDVARFVNPYGPQSVWDALAPSTVKRVQELVQDQSKEHMYDTERMYMQMLGEYRTDPEKFGGKAPTWEQAADRAKWIGVLKIVNNSSNPFPAVFDSKYKLYQDSYRDLLEKQRRDNHEQGWATDQFIKAHGESFFPLVQSMSKNNAGLTSSAEAVEASKRYKSEISKYGIGADGKPNATLIRLIVGREGEGEFNQSAHRWQETREISPASGYEFRDVSNAQEAASDADVNLGWYKYQAFVNSADAEANTMGFRTYKESEELVDRYQAFVAGLKDMLPAWRQDFESMDTGKFTRNLEDLAQVANSKKFSGVERTDMAGVRQYLTARQALQTQLQDLGISEGSQDAEPFKRQFTEMVMDMAGTNTSFTEWAFHPFLERDPLLSDIIPQPGDPTDQTTAPTWGVMG